jgi:hypothetical protein
MPTFKPFENEEDAVAINDLTIENRLDRIEIYGSLQITKDKAGLKLAKELEELINTTITALQTETLPDHVPVKPADKVDNPFKF